jgi:hypothetical protein
MPSRQVNSDEAKKIADSNHAAFVETSAKNNTNVGEYLRTPPSVSRSYRSHRQGFPALFAGDRETLAV